MFSCYAEVEFIDIPSSLCFYFSRAFFENNFLFASKKCFELLQILYNFLCCRFFSLLSQRNYWDLNSTHSELTSGRTNSTQMASSKPLWEEKIPILSFCFANEFRDLQRERKIDSALHPQLRRNVKIIKKKPISLVTNWLFNYEVLRSFRRNSNPTFNCIRYLYSPFVVTGFNESKSCAIIEWFSHENLIHSIPFWLKSNLRKLYASIMVPCHATVFTLLIINRHFACHCGGKVK